MEGRKMRGQGKGTRYNRMWEELMYVLRNRQVAFRGKIQVASVCVCVGGGSSSLAPDPTLSRGETVW